MDIELTYNMKNSPTDIASHLDNTAFEVITHSQQRRLADSSNLLILGDNLAALEGLLRMPDVGGKVNLVYIDPPFATDKEYRIGSARTATVSCARDDQMAYDDKLRGDEYLEFLGARLVLLREIMGNSASIYVHIDWKVGHYVKVLMDEIFGQERCINDITRIKCNPKNFRVKGYGDIKDMILFYSKTEDYVWNDSREELGEENIERLYSKVDEQGRRYTTTPLHAPGETQNGATGRPWKGLNPPRGRHWRCSPEELTRLDKNGLIEWSSNGNPRKKIYAEEAIREGKKRQNIWEFKDPAYPQYPTQKNLNMLKVIIEASSNPGDLLLDCFAGSGTTLIAAEELGRRWIGIDQSPHAIDVTQKRLNGLKSPADFVLLKVCKHQTHT